MYKSPIEMTYGELQTQIMQEDENIVMKAVRKVRVDIDKEALIKALQYDRSQYTKGYEDGKNDVINKIRAEIEQKARPNEIAGRVNGKSIRYGLCMALEIIDKYKSESEVSK